MTLARATMQPRRRARLTMAPNVALGHLVPQRLLRPSPPTWFSHPRTPTCRRCQFSKRTSSGTSPASPASSTNPEACRRYHALVPRRPPVPSPRCPSITSYSAKHWTSARATTSMARSHRKLSPRLPPLDQCGAPRPPSIQKTLTRLIAGPKRLRDSRQRRTAFSRSRRGVTSHGCKHSSPHRRPRNGPPQLAEPFSSLIGSISSPATRSPS